MWVNALLDVRYDRNYRYGLDGSVYIFTTYIRGNGWLTGKTWEPRGGVPLWMKEAGGILANYVSAAKPDEIELNKSLTILKDKLIDYMVSHSNLGPEEIENKSGRGK